MKAVKKVFAMLLAVVMVMGLSITAFAYTPTNNNCLVTFPGGSSGYGIMAIDDDDDIDGTNASTRTYNGYKLLNLTTSKNPDGTYNYAYTVNPTYRSILQTQVFNATEFWKDDKPDYESGVSDEQIVAYLESLTDSDAIRTFADAVYQAILEDTNITEPDKTVTNGIADIAQGYWLFADVTTFGDNDTDTAHSLVLLDTKGQESLTITEKVDSPEVGKQVSSTKDGTYGDYTSVDVGDTVYFQLTGTLPEYLSSYETYKYVFHDTLSSGLTYNDGSVTVTIDGAAVGTGSYTVATSSLGDSCNLHISFDNILSATDEAGTDIEVTATSKVVVAYTATLNDNALTTDVETNTVYLEYSNNPYGDGTGKTTEKTVSVYDFDIVINKYEKGNEETKLERAQFVLYKLDNGEKLYYHYQKADKGDTNAEVQWTSLSDIIAAINAAHSEDTDWNNLSTEATLDDVLALGAEIYGDYITVVTTDGEGAASFQGLAAGTYYLHETEAPNGYNLLKGDVKVEIEIADGGTTWTVTVDDGTAKELAVTSEKQIEATVDVENSTGTELPETGGIGTTIFYVVGSILVVGAAVLLIVKKRMNGTER